MENIRVISKAYNPKPIILKNPINLFEIEVDNPVNHECILNFVVDANLKCVSVSSDFLIKEWNGSYLKEYGMGYIESHHKQNIKKQRILNKLMKGKDKKKLFANKIKNMRMHEKFIFKTDVCIY